MSFSHERDARLPSLKALHVFSVAGRCGTLSQAARELFVTQGAVSKQIRLLEDELGIELFVRSGRRVALSPEGRDLLAGVIGAFGSLRDAVAGVARRRQANVLTITALPSFAAKWLAPRLGSFLAQEPAIELRIAASAHLADLSTGEADIAIRYGPGGWQGVHAERFLAETLFPVCSPALLRGARRLRAPSDLRRATLLHSDIREGWTAWLRKAHVAGVQAEGGLKFDDDLALLQAAAAGVGVALGRSRLVEAELRSGALVAPFPVAIRSRYAYWIVRPKGGRRNAVAERFVTWLRRQAAAALPP